MTALAPIPPKKMVAILLRLGFKFDRQKGSHAYYKHADGRSIAIPMHAGEDLGKGLIREILRSIVLSVADYESLRRSV